MNEAADVTGKFLVDPYLEWTKRECVPIHEDVGFDLNRMPVGMWPRFGTSGCMRT